MSEGAAPASSCEPKEKEFVLNADGSILIDHKGKPVTVDRFLSTKPIRAEVSTRKGPGGMKLTYMGGDMVTKTLNEAFGYDGWCMEVKNTTREEPMKDEKGRYHVAYIATVRVTHRRSGVFREDCGAGDSIDKSLASASGNALKGAVTDAMKRAARHFGEKLGNSMYHDGFSASNAPNNLRDALDTLDIERAKSRFGFDKDRKAVAVSQTDASRQSDRRSSAPAAMARQEAKKAPSGSGPNPAPSGYQPAPRTQYVGNVVMEQPGAPGHVHKRLPPHVTPHPKAGVGGKENSDPQGCQPPKTPGLALPPRPGTSRGGKSPTSAYIANYPASTGGTPSMFGAKGSMSQALVMEQQNQMSIAQSLKRKSEVLDENAGAMNPYNC